MYFIKSFKIHVRHIKDVEAIGLERYEIQCVHIVNRRIGEQNELGNGGLQIKLGVQFYPCFGFSELSQKKADKQRSMVVASMANTLPLISTGSWLSSRHKDFASLMSNWANSS